MPPRLSRSSLPKRAQPVKPAQTPRKRKQRGLNAFSIAQHLTPDENGVSRHRFGELDEDEDDRRSSKRPKVDGEESEKEESREKGSDEGSDGEGITWRVGEVGSDDSDIDSDEAFGESDEEKFSGFSFGKSKQKQKQKLKKNIVNGLDLDETIHNNAEESDDSFGDEAVDLATVLDQGGQESSESGSEHDTDNNGNNADDDDSEHPFSDEEDDEDDDVLDEERVRRLQQVVKSLPTVDGSQHQNGQLTGNAALLQALRGASNLDKSLQHSTQKLARLINPDKGSKPLGPVAVPLPKRQQDRLNREAAYSTAKTTLSRWLDTVKHNRRADHLSFPLHDPEAQEPQGTTRLLPSISIKIKTDLESTIEGILEQSGLGTLGTDETSKELELEGIQAKQMPPEELAARTAELRRARDLLFREEMRAKRISKIKSKAYRRVHRRERETEAKRELAQKQAAGLEMSDDEREKIDRRRAEARMGDRHKESRWAKSIKQSGRAAWDEDARLGVNDMARRSDEQRLRMPDRPLSDDEDSSIASDGIDAIDDGDDEGAETRMLQRQLDHVDGKPIAAHSRSKLGNMKFMLRAEAKNRQINDEAVESLRRDLADENSQDEEEEEPLHAPGRRMFAPAAKEIDRDVPKEVPNELEEKQSDDEEESNTRYREGSPEQGEAVKVVAKAKHSAPKRQLKALSSGKIKMAGEINSMSNSHKISDEQTSKPLKDSTFTIKPMTAPSNQSNWQAIPYTHKNDDIETEIPKVEDTTNVDNLVLSNEALVQRAFAGDMVSTDFHAEKEDAIQDEGDKIIDNTLPGWGSWIGEGVSKRELARNKDRFVTKQAGVKAANRKDAKLERAIISEKRIKKNAKYMASVLPHPFESRQQYERSLRLPIGPEWTTKETFQKATKPRVMVKRGIIRPMEKPLL